MAQYTFRITAILTVWVLLWNCNSNPSTTVAQSREAVLPKVHVAFSGGGWRAHTGHTGWTIALLGNGSLKLNNVFANVGALSSNSGGSWFSTMLMYSDSFNQKIQARNAISSWNTSGWLGQQYALFAKVPPCKVYPYLACVADYYTNGKEAYWNRVVNDLVFHDYPLGTLTLSGARQAWAAQKPLLLAATMLTNNVVLNASPTDDDTQYYQACLSPSKPALNGYNGSSCTGGTAPDVTPVTFSSIPGGSNLVSLPFLREAGTSSQFNIGYTENALWSADTARASIQNPLTTAQVPVVIAAAASSAAIGFIASENVSGYWDVSYEGEEESLSFQLANAAVQQVDTKGMTLQTLAAQKMVRIADGGAVDNSGVVQLVSFLQANKQAANFNIVAFDNVQGVYKPASGNNGAMAGVDIANLFGLGISPPSQMCISADGVPYCVSLPNLQIFDSTAMNKTPATWQNVTQTKLGPQGVIYTKYTVTTVDNHVMGISKGTTGTLHAFTCVWPTANTAPTSNADFATYNAMLQFIYNSLQANNGEGQKLLNRAMGL